MQRVSIMDKSGLQHAIMEYHQTGKRNTGRVLKRLLGYCIETGMRHEA
jgi:hypothetical protein